MCAATDELALSRNEGATFFEWCLRNYGSKQYAPGAGSLWERYRTWRASDEGQKKHYSGGLVGSPETIRGRLRRFEESHIDQVIFLVQNGKVKHEEVCESLELFAREVMPEFHERETQHQEWKRAVLKGELELADPDDDELAVDARRVPGSGPVRV
jgi:alkanesulfonate monooxygenase SsuD/methylene tetrahydromethanopterin reductase-like flavin-dependent oxidoreductase (luciferase family)